MIFNRLQRLKFTLQQHMMCIFIVRLYPSVRFHQCAFAFGIINHENFQRGHVFLSWPWLWPPMISNLAHVPLRGTVRNTMCDFMSGKYRQISSLYHSDDLKCSKRVSCRFTRSASYQLKAPLCHEETNPLMPTCTALNTHPIQFKSESRKKL